MVQFLAELGTAARPGVVTGRAGSCRGGTSGLKLAHLIRDQGEGNAPRDSSHVLSLLVYLLSMSSRDCPLPLCGPSP